MEWSLTPLVLVRVQAGQPLPFFYPEFFHAEARRRGESHLSLLGFLCVSAPLLELFYFEKPAGGL